MLTVPKPRPMRKKMPGEGIFSITRRTKYGPSNFAVSPVLESPTTIPGR